MKFKLKQNLWVEGRNHVAGDVVDLSDNAMIENLLNKELIEEAKDGDTGSDPVPQEPKQPETPPSPPADKGAPATTVPLAEGSTQEQASAQQPQGSEGSQPQRVEPPQPKPSPSETKPSDIVKTLETLEGPQDNPAPDVHIS